MEKKEKMEKSPRHRSNARALTLAVIEILMKFSDKDHPMSCADIVRKLAEYPYCSEEYDIRIGSSTRDTVKDILTDIERFYHAFGCIQCKTTEREYKNKEEINDYTYDYYYEKLFSDEEIQMLIDDVIFSRMRTEEQAKILADKLKSMASDSFQKKYGSQIQIPDKQYTLNKEMEKNISMIRTAVIRNLGGTGKEAWIRFAFCGYGTDLQMHMKGKKFCVLPLRICEAYQNYYLICYMKNTNFLSHYRIDLMKDLKVIEKEAEKHPTKQNLINSLQQSNISEYLSQHLYMYYESEKNKVREIRLKVNKIRKYPSASMTFLQDAFGRNWKTDPKTENDESVEVLVKCVPSAMLVFVRQHMRDVMVLAPEDVKNMVNDEIEKDLNEYIKKSKN